MWGKDDRNLSLLVDLGYSADVKSLFAILLSVCSVIQPTFAEGFATGMLEATYKLFHEKSTATCFLVTQEAPDQKVYLVTAAHVLERMEGETAILVLRERLEDGTFVRRDFPVVIRRDEQPLWVRDAQVDLAILRLDDLPSFPIGTIPFRSIADEGVLESGKLEICRSLFLLTYPQRFEGSEGGFAVARQAIVSSRSFLPLVKHPTYLADFTTFSGDSGGPVFIAGENDQPLVVGVVLAQTRHDERVKTEYEERVIHHPLGLGTVLHAQFVRALIENVAEAE